MPSKSSYMYALAVLTVLACVAAYISMRSNSKTNPTGINNQGKTPPASPASPAQTGQSGQTGQQTAPFQAAGLAILQLNQTIEICDIQPGTYQPINCAATCSVAPIDSVDNETAPCAVAATAPKVVRVTRVTAPTDAGYLLYIGPIGETQANVLIDTYDSPVFTNEQRLATSSLVSGWSMTLRNRPYPPGRTGRITPGRPRLFPGIFNSGPEKFITIPLTDTYPATCMPLHNNETYATLNIVKPGSDEVAGESWVMTRDMGEDDRLAIFAHDGTTVDLSKFICLTHETYAVFTWDANNPKGSWSAVQTLPSLGWLQTNRPFAHTAITGCYQNSGKRFFAQEQ